MIIRHHTLNEHELKLTKMSDDEFIEYMNKTYPTAFSKSTSTKLSRIFGTFSIGEGWRHVLDSLCSQLILIEKATNIHVVFSCIKEKFGTARFYYSTHLLNLNDCHKLSKEEYEKWCRIIGTLVDHHEEYCCYIDDISGVACNPSDKIRINGWYFGHTYLSRLKSIMESDDTDEVKAAHIARLKTAVTREGKSVLDKNN